MQATEGIECRWSEMYALQRSLVGSQCAGLTQCLHHVHPQGAGPPKPCHLFKWWLFLYYCRVLFLDRDSWEEWQGTPPWDWAHQGEILSTGWCEETLQVLAPDLQGQHQPYRWASQHWKLLWFTSHKVEDLLVDARDFSIAGWKNHSVQEEIRWWRNVLKLQRLCLYRW